MSPPHFHRCVWTLASLLLLRSHLTGAENLDDAARELGKRIILNLGAKEPATLKVRNASLLSNSELERVHRTLVKTLNSQGVPTPGTSPGNLEVSVTLSENVREYLLVAEIRRNQKRLVTMISLRRPLATPVTELPANLVIEKQLVWEQEQQILDLSLNDSELLLLNPSTVTLYQKRDERWELTGSASLLADKVRPRDLRGRLRIEGDDFEAYLPGILCHGSKKPSLSVACAENNAPWPLESGSGGRLEAALAGDRNFFDGVLGKEASRTKSVGPFFSGASLDDGDKGSWLLIGVDGRARLYNAALDLLGTFEGWGGDMASLQGGCRGEHRLLLATAGEAGEEDSVQAYDLVEQQPVAVTEPVKFSGTVTALWPTEAGEAATVVSRDRTTGRHAAFRLAVSCTR